MKPTEKKKIEMTVHEGDEVYKQKPSVLRVAAYCRVSTLAEEQELSFESQKEYFKKLIEADEHMKLVGVFGDHGLSGLNARDRPQLQKMLEMARNGEIDLIMAKSVSRMARNVIDLQEILKEMKECGVVVVFERENLRSDDPQCELVVKFLAAIAQEESNSISQAVTWGHDRNNKLGKPTQKCPYGFRKKQGTHEWEIYEPEAEMVRIAFNLAKARFPTCKIAGELKEEEKNHPDAEHRAWNTQTVEYILQNVAYMGDVLTNKTFTVDYLTKTRKVNEGEKEQFYLQDHHPAIVSRKLFAEVKSLITVQTRKPGRPRKTAEEKTAG